MWQDTHPCGYVGVFGSLRKGWGGSTVKGMYRPIVPMGFSPLKPYPVYVTD